MLYFKNETKGNKNHKLEDYVGVQYFWEGEPFFITYSYYDDCLIQINEAGDFRIIIQKLNFREEETTWEDIFTEMGIENADNINYMKNYDICISKVEEDV